MPAGHRVGPGVGGVERAEHDRRDHARAPAGRPGAHHLHRERDHDQRRGDREHVRVQVAQREGEGRELVDRARHHARGGEPVVGGERPGGLEELTRRREVAEHQAERDGQQPAADRPAGPRAAAQAGPQRRAERERGGRREREERRDGQVVAAARLDARQSGERAHGHVAEVVVVQRLPRDPGVRRRERRGGLHGGQEGHVHRLLGPPDVRREGDQDDHRREGDEEHRLGGDRERAAQRIRRASATAAGHATRTRRPAPGRRPRAASRPSPPATRSRPARPPSRPPRTRAAWRSPGRRPAAARAPARSAARRAGRAARAARGSAGRRTRDG